MKEIHFCDVKKNYCVVLKKSYKNKLLGLIASANLPLYKVAKLSKIDESILREFKNNPVKKVEINTLLKLINFLNQYNFKLNLEDIEKQINWIGPHVGRGISNPKLPFKLDNMEFARILSAIFGDGTITNRSGNSTKYKLGVMEYWNEEEILRYHIISCAIKVFGGNRKDYLELPNRNSVCIRFPSIIRDVTMLGGGVQGEKSVLNPSIPNIVMHSENSKMWIEWLKQAFEDEGSVRFRNNYNHEIYLTRVMDATEFLKKENVPKGKMSFKKLSKKAQKLILNNPVNLLENEKNLLEKLGVMSVLRPQEIYWTKDDKIKVKWRLYLTRKANIRHFSQVISFGTHRKLATLNKIVGDKSEIYTQNKRNPLEPKIGTIYKREMGKREDVPV